MKKQNNKKNNKIKIGFILLTLLAISAMVISTKYYGKGKSNSLEDGITKLYSPIFEQCLKNSCLGFETPDCPDVSRRLTGNMEEYIPRESICELPTKPSDFDRIKFLFQTGKAGVMADIDKNYWVQPEFLSNWELTDMLWYQNPEMGYLVTYSVAVYPSEMILEIETEESNNKEWQTFDVLTTLRSSRTIFYTGLKLTESIKGGGVALTQNSFSDNGKVAYNPKNLGDYVKISFTPKEMILAQSFPVFRMGDRRGGYNYVEEVNMLINVSPSIPKGRYMVGMQFANPSKEFAYKHQVQNKLYNLYRNGGDNVVGLDMMRVFIWVK